MAALIEMKIAEVRVFLLIGEPRRISRCASPSSASAIRRTAAPPEEPPVAATSACQGVPLEAVQPATRGPQPPRSPSMKTVPAAIWARSSRRAAPGYFHPNATPNAAPGTRRTASSSNQPHIDEAHHGLEVANRTSRKPVPAWRIDQVPARPRKPPGWTARYARLPVEIGIVSAPSMPWTRCQRNQAHDDAGVTPLRNMIAMAGKPIASVVANSLTPAWGSCRGR